jgi:hypothetical protein
MSPGNQGVFKLMKEVTLCLLYHLSTASVFIKISAIASEKRFCYYYGIGMLGCVAKHLIWEISD